MAKVRVPVFRTTGKSVLIETDNPAIFGVNIYDRRGKLVDLASLQQASTSSGPDTTDDLAEGIYNHYFTTERAQDAVAALLTDSENVTLAYDDAAGTLTADLTALADSGAGDLLGLTRDAYGRLTGTRDVDTDDLNEGGNLYFTDKRAQDAIGAILTNTDSIGLTYDDANNVIEAALKASGVTADTYGDATHVGQFTVDADGRLTLAAEVAIDSYTQSAADALLADKVDKVTGKGLSTEDYTSAEKAKLAGLEGSHYKGTYTSLSALQAAVTAPGEGDYGDVDAGAGSNVERYLWDDSDSAWVKLAGDTGSLTAAQVKSLYESNADTNAFTDGDISKLTGIAAGAEVNVQPNWNEANTGSDAFIRNKPNLFSGIYADLTGKPSLFDGQYSSLTGAPTIPDALSDLDNDAGFITGIDASDVDTAVGVRLGYLLEDSVSQSVLPGSTTWNAIRGASSAHFAVKLFCNDDRDSFAVVADSSFSGGEPDRVVFDVDSRGAGTFADAVEARNFLNDVPTDFWSSGQLNRFLGYGYVGTNGSYSLSLRSNGYRDDGNNWQSLNSGGNTGASGIDLRPDGFLRLGANTATPTGYDVTWRIRVEEHAMRPEVDDQVQLGNSSHRYKNVYAVDGSINTSDGREKIVRGTLTTAETQAAQELSAAGVLYQWKESVATKGHGARWHCAPIAQTVIEILQRHDLDPFRYGFVCYDEWPEQQTIMDETGATTQEYRSAGSRYSLRPSELASFIAAGMAEQISGLSRRITKLEKDK